MGGCCFMGREFQSGKMKKGVEVDGGDFCITSVYVLDASERYLFKWLKR